MYAAGFSGHILVFNAHDEILSRIIDVASSEMGKLSGLAIAPSSRFAYTTIENKHETAAVSLEQDKVAQNIPDFAANHWIIAK